METTTEPAITILQAMHDLRTGAITADDYRATMADLRGRLGEHGYNVAKLQAVANDR